MRDDETILFQARERFAQRNLAHAQFRGQRVLADRQLRLDGARQDEVAQDFDQAVGQSAYLEVDRSHRVSAGYLNSAISSLATDDTRTGDPESRRFECIFRIVRAAP